MLVYYVSWYYDLAGEGEGGRRAGVDGSQRIYSNGGNRNETVDLAEPHFR